MILGVPSGTASEGRGRIEGHNLGRLSVQVFYSCAVAKSPSVALFYGYFCSGRREFFTWWDIVVTYPQFTSPLPNLKCQQTCHRTPIPAGYASMWGGVGGRGGRG